MNAIVHNPTLALRRFIRGWLYDWSVLLIMDANVSAAAFEAYAAKYISQDDAAGEADHIRQNLYRIMWSRLIDHFQTYLSTLLFTILEARPDLVARAAKAAELKKVPPNARQAARRIHGFRVYERVFKVLGVPLPLSDSDRAVIRHGIEFRNVIVHAAGVDEQGRFIEPPKDSGDVDLIPGIAFDQLMAVERAVRNVATALDASAVGVFNIGTPK